MAWSWEKARQKGLRISVPLSDLLSLAAEYRDSKLPGKGVVLFFDPDLVLEERDLLSVTAPLS